MLHRTIRHRSSSTSSSAPVFAPCWSSRCSVPTGSSARWSYAGSHRLSLINEVLDLSKIEAGKLELNPERVDLARLIDEVIGTAGQLAEKNQNRLVVEAQENLGALTADSMRLKQILLIS